MEKHLPEAIKEKVKAALLALDPLNSHKQVLKNWSKTEMPGGCFAPIPRIMTW